MRNTIKNHRDFIPGENEPIAVMPPFLVRMRPTLFPGDARYGLTATKKTFKLAVERNRAKRLLRAWLRENEELLRQDMDYIFVARRPILDTDKSAGVTIMKKALKKLNG